MWDFVFIEIAEHDNRTDTYPASRPVPHNRSMSESGTRVQGIGHRGILPSTAYC